MRHRTARMVTLAFAAAYTLLLVRILSKYKLGSKEEDNDFEVDGWERGVSRRVWDYVDVNDWEVDSWKILELKEFDPSSWPRVLVVVLSAPENFAKRELVRNNHGIFCSERFFGDEDSFCRLVFALGDRFVPLSPRSLFPEPQSTMAMLRGEAEAHGDLLLGDFVDSYNNLTLKSVHALRFFVGSDLDFTHVFKVDDNCFFNLIALESLVSGIREGHRQDAFIHGRLWEGTRPLRSSAGLEGDSELLRFLTPRYLFPEDVFPDYMGSSYVISRAAAECLLEATFEEPLFFLEDVFVTGLLARRCRGQVAMIPDKEGRFELAPKDEEERAAKKGAASEAAEQEEAEDGDPGKVIMVHLRDGPAWEREVLQLWTSSLASAWKRRKGGRQRDLKIYRLLRSSSSSVLNFARQKKGESPPVT